MTRTVIPAGIIYTWQFLMADTPEVHTSVAHTSAVHTSAARNRNSTAEARTWAAHTEEDMLTAGNETEQGDLPSLHPGCRRSLRKYWCTPRAVRRTDSRKAAKQPGGTEAADRPADHTEAVPCKSADTSPGDLQPEIRVS
jgi:hypothetical protein